MTRWTIVSPAARPRRGTLAECEDRAEPAWFVATRRQHMLMGMADGTRLDQALTRAAETQSEIDRLAKQRELAVARAMHWGATWAQIGESLGVSAQSAHRRFRWLRYDPATRCAWPDRPTSR